MTRRISGTTPLASWYRLAQYPVQAKAQKMLRRSDAAREDTVVKKIALEEHFLCPGFIEYWDPTVAGMPAAKRERLLALNTDFGEMRLASMDRAGIERA